MERIVDQVVNPKIGSVFQPRIEEIAYKYLGIPPPPPVKYDPSAMLHAPLPPLPPMNGDSLKVETCPSLMPHDLEQISPDSDKATVKSECKSDHGDVDMDLDDDKPAEEDEEESPAFEPLLNTENNKLQNEKDSSNSDMDLACDSPLAPPGVDLNENSCSLEGPPGTEEPQQQPQPQTDCGCASALYGIPQALCRARKYP